jgi:glycine betaine/proline transport system permease protein
MSDMAVARGSTDPGLMPVGTRPRRPLEPVRRAGSDVSGRPVRAPGAQAGEAWEVNWQAVVQGPIWAALRGSWVLFWIGLILDTIGLMLIARALFPPAGVDTGTTLGTGLLVLVLGRLAQGLLADRVYMRQFNRWRVDRTVPHGVAQARLLKAGLLFLLVVPLLVYRATQQVPSFRECRRMWRDAAGGEVFPFADRFNCLFIGELPVDQRTLHDPIAASIDNSVDWLVINLEWLFDAITVGVRWLLQSLETVLVGTPWPVVLVPFRHARLAAGGAQCRPVRRGRARLPRRYGLLGKAMSTLSLVGAATVICVVLGVPSASGAPSGRAPIPFIRPALDIMQTLPSFVYLIPAIAFFGVGKPPGILATVIFALPPMVRLTVLGIHQVPKREGGRGGLSAPRRASCSGSRAAAGRFRPSWRGSIKPS